MTFKYGYGTALVAGVLLAALMGCQKQEGPAEKVGKAVDNAAQSAGLQVEKAGQRIQDAAKGDTDKDGDKK